MVYWETRVDPIGFRTSSINRGTNVAGCSKLQKVGLNDDLP